MTEDAKTALRYPGSSDSGTKKWWPRLSNIILAAQPLLATPIFFSVLLGIPPLWLSWLLALTPLALRFWRHGHLVRRTPFDIPILLFALGLLVGLVVSPNPAVSLGAFNTFLACILIYYGLVSNSYAKNSYWLSAAVIFCLIALGLSIWFFSEGAMRLLPFTEWFFKITESLPKVGGPTLHLHSLAAVLAVITPALLALALFKNGPRLRLTGLMVGLGFLAIMVLTASGSGWIAVALGLILVILCWRPLMARLVLPALGIITWLAVLNYDKVAWLSQVFSVDTFLSRIDHWRNTIGLLKDHPFGGLGLGGWFEVYNDAHNSAVVNVHNSYLQLYADTGFLGLVAMIWAMIIFLVISWRILTSSKQSIWYGVGVGIIGGIIAGAAQAVVEVTNTGTIVESSTSYLYLGIPLLWTWAALLIVSYNRLQAAKHPG